MKFGWFRTLMAVTFNSNLTRSVIGIRLMILMSRLKYLGPLRLFIGKLPKVPGAGAVISPAFNVDVVTVPLGLRVMCRRFGVMKQRPPGVVNSPALFFN